MLLVSDPGGNPVPGVTVTFSAPASTGSGACSIPIASAAGEPPDGRPITVSSSSSATSNVFIRLSSSGCTVGMPSSNIWMQKGHAVATICAPTAPDHPGITAETGPAQVFVVDDEAQWFDEMQRGVGGDAQTADRAGIGGNFGRDQDDLHGGVTPVRCRAG